MFLTNVISGNGHFGAVNFNIGAFSAHVDSARVFNVIFGDIMAVANMQIFVRFVDFLVHLLQYVHDCVYYVPKLLQGGSF